MGPEVVPPQTYDYDALNSFGNEKNEDGRESNGGGGGVDDGGGGVRGEIEKGDED